MVRMGFKPTIFVISNNGYTIERVIHGPKQRYNDISTLWDHQAMLKFFGAKNSISCMAKTAQELRNILENDAFRSNNQIQLCEIFMDESDSPWRLTDQIAFTQGNARRKLEERDVITGTKRTVLA